MELFLHNGQNLLAVEDFWKKKNSGLNNKLLIAALARYKDIKSEIDTETTGILYVMENGVYFENFQQPCLPQIKTEQCGQRKIFIQIPVALISGVEIAREDNCGYLTRLFSTPAAGAAGINIHYRAVRNKLQTVRFDTYLEPQKICRILQNSFSLS